MALRGWMWEGLMDLMGSLLVLGGFDGHFQGIALH